VAYAWCRFPISRQVAKGPTSYIHRYTVIPVIEINKNRPILYILFIPYFSLFLLPFLFIVHFLYVCISFFWCYHSGEWCIYISQHVTTWCLPATVHRQSLTSQRCRKHRVKRALCCPTWMSAFAPSKLPAGRRRRQWTPSTDSRRYRSEFSSSVGHLDRETVGNHSRDFLAVQSTFASPSAMTAWRHHHGYTMRPLFGLFTFNQKSLQVGLCLFHCCLRTPRSFASNFSKPFLISNLNNIFTALRALHATQFGQQKAVCPSVC